LSEIYWHFHENRNPSFCPGKKQGEGMSMDDRFKESRGCLRPCSCDDCRTSNIDRATVETVYLSERISERVSDVLATFFNYYFIWTWVAFIFFSWSLLQGYFNVGWYHKEWLYVAVPSGFFSVLGLWLMTHIRLD